VKGRKYLVTNRKRGGDEKIGEGFILRWEKAKK
jgi:hypothetical protein